MQKTNATLHMLCGKMASGKSTLCAALAERNDAIIVSEDFWLARLFGAEMASVDDYARCAGKLRAAMAPHLVDLLRAGVSVVLDFPANTVATRAWMRGVIEAAGTDHLLHFLEVPDEVCRARLHRRNAEGAHDFAPTDEQFDVITRYFEPPSEEEGFTIRIHRGDSVLV